MVPRIEEPPARRARRATEADALRQFVRDAGGKWCVVAESRATSKPSRNRLRSQVFSTFRAKSGGRTEFEILAATDKGVSKVFARLIVADSGG
jgi:hypothetical protein